MSPSGKALVSDTSIPGFESLHPSHIQTTGFIGRKKKDAWFASRIKNWGVAKW
ncbi:hypothetical protein predicted by Glimmer/Critica [Erwinia amylovora CFBP1430]|uniref:Uncharacterized protein n=1 Tax=Erwinia amylovora (strain CFBP1430) TaxID=665029 RepID=D4HYW3_ERWAC|nr:hypothetical protein predicted by Glimmer/Critica [Erwinia amylovora CFBP1430]